jgi:hypothetical protein
MTASDMRIEAILWMVALVLYAFIAISPRRFFSLLASGRKFPSNAAVVLAFRLLGIVCVLLAAQTIYRLLVLRRP